MVETMGGHAILKGSAPVGWLQLSGAEFLLGPGNTGGERGGFFERSHMYAVIKTGGKQYKVAAGEKIKVEQIAADVGQEIVIEQVLAVGSGADLKVGAPWVAGANVKATVLAHGRHDKVRIFKMRRRKHYQKHGGHRQNYTELEIGSVNA